MADPADVLTPDDLTYTGLEADRLERLIRDAFALADQAAGYKLSLPGFNRIPQLRAILRKSIEFYAEQVKERPASVQAGPMSVAWQRPTPSSVWFTPAQEDQIRALVAGPSPVGTIRVGLACGFPPRWGGGCG